MVQSVAGYWNTASPVVLVAGSRCYLRKERQERTSHPQAGGAYVIYLFTYMMFMFTYQS